jgi:hypothetical protein
VIGFSAVTLAERAVDHALQVRSCRTAMLSQP